MKKLDLFAPLLRGGRSAVVLLLLAVAVFAVQSVRADGPAQPKKRMSIALTGATLDDVLQHIKRETGYLLLYNSNSIKAVKGITLHRQNAPVEEILREALHGTGLDFSISEDTIIIRVREADKASKSDAQGTAAPAPPQRVTLTGRVTNRATKAPIPGAMVHIQGTTGGTTTDPDG